MATMNDLARDIAEWRKGKGFYTPDRWTGPAPVTATMQDMILSKLMLVTTEVAEAAEAVRHGNGGNFAEELADTIIRILDLTGTMGIDIEQEVRLKMERNRDRPYKHGKEA